MQHDHFKRSWALALSLVWLMLLGVKASMAQEKIPVAGEMVLAVIKYQEMNVRDTKDHALFLLEYEGNNVSRGKQEFMNESQAGMLLFGDLENRSGPIQGYFEFQKKRDTVFSTRKDNLTTSYSSKGTPVTTFEGAFSYIKRFFDSCTACSNPALSNTSHLRSFSSSAPGNVVPTICFSPLDMVRWFCI